MKHVIIGVGAAGITAAKTLREKDPNCSITMISTDTHVHSRCMLHRYLSHERNEDTLSFVEPDFFETNRITWIKGAPVRTIDVEQKLVRLENGNSQPFDQLLIATGANSFIPPVGQFREANNVFGLRNLSDAQAIRPLADQADKILIVGSGLVGMDAAYAFLEQGKDVTVVEMADRILPIQLNETAGQAYKDLFEAHGCRFLLGKKASETHMNDQGGDRLCLSGRWNPYQLRSGHRCRRGSSRTGMRSGYSDRHRSLYQGIRYHGDQLPEYLCSR